MSLKTQAAKGLKWQMIQLAGKQLLSLVVFTMLARLLTPESFGLFGMVGVYLAFVGMFVSQGIGTAIIQQRDLVPEHLNSAFWYNIMGASLLCLGTIILSRPIAHLYNEPRLASMLPWCSLALVINAASAVHSALFSREMDFRRPAIRTLIANGVGGVVGVAMAWSGYEVWALVGQQLAVSLAGSLFIWTASTWRPTGWISVKHLRELFPVSSSVFGTQLLWFYSSRIDQITIGKFAGPAALGQYVVGRKLSELATTAIGQPLGAISVPVFSRLQNDYRKMRNAIYKGMELNALVSFAVFIGLASVAPDLVPLAFGAQWTNAGITLQLTSLYGLALGLFVYCHPALLASGGPGKYVLVNAASAVGATLACFAGSKFGVNALVIGLTINLVVVGTVALLFLKSRIGMSPWQYCRPMLIPALASAVMFFAVLFARSLLHGHVSPWVGLILQVLAGACVYALLMCVLAFSSLQRLAEVALRGIQKAPA